MSCRHNPAGGDQGAGAEVLLPDVNGRHPGVSTWQSGVSAHYAPPGDPQPLLVLFPTHWLLGRLAGSGLFNAGQDINLDPSRRC